MELKSKFSLAIFDLGNVVFQIDWNSCLDIWSEASGIDSKLLKQRFRFDDTLEAFERGQIRNYAYYHHLCQILNMKLSYDQFLLGWNSIYKDTIAEVQCSLEKLKEKLRIVAFTNTNEAHSLVWPKKYKTVLENFEHIFVSSEIGHRKPEISSFKYVLGACGVPGNEAIFFDDYPPNINAALELGLHAVLVDSPKKVTQELCRLSLL